MKILLFAHLKRVAGKAEIELDLQGSLTVDELWQRLTSLYPALEAQRSVVRLAVNSEFARPESCFQNSDEVALIPPVSGG